MKFVFLLIIFLLTIYTIKSRRNLIIYFLILAMTIWLATMIIKNPKVSFNSALQGLNTWLYIVLPSLLPFLIISDLLYQFGFVHFLSILLEPITSFLFKVPGEGSYAYAMSITSGYPVGAKIVSELRKDKVVTNIEAQRILSFSSTSGPLFMIGAVSIGMFKNPDLGPLIAISHYISALTIGFIFRFYSPDKPKNYNREFKGFKCAFNEMIYNYKKQKKPLGLILSDSVNKSFNTIIMIGGFIILFSVFIELFSISSLNNYLSNFVRKILPSVYNENLTNSLISGFIEMTIGCKKIASLNSVNYVVKVALTSLIIGWSGLSIHSQVLSLIAKTDIKISIYILSKVLHGFLASIYTIILFDFFTDKYIETSAKIDYINPTNFVDIIGNWFYIINYSLKLLTFTLLISIIIGLITSLIKKSR